MLHGKKIKIIFICILLFVFGLFGYLYYKNEQMVPVLGYHGILPSDMNVGHPELIIDAELFEHQLKLLNDMGYKSLTLDEYYCWHEKKCKKSHKSVLITFDDGIYNNYEYAFPLLKKYNMNAVVFVIGQTVDEGAEGYLSRDDLVKIREEYPNIEIASHSYNHHYYLATKYSEVVEDDKLMKTVIDTNYFAYPHGDYTDEYIKALKDRGYKMAFTFGPKKEHRKSSLKDDNYKIPRLNISNGMSDYKFILRLLLPI